MKRVAAVFMALAIGCVALQAAAHDVEVVGSITTLTNEIVAIKAELAHVKARLDEGSVEWNQNRDVDFLYEAVIKLENQLEAAGASLQGGDEAEAEAEGDA